MRICFLGNSHLTHYSIVGAAKRGLELVPDPEQADLLILAHDTATNEEGQRELISIREMVKVYCGFDKPTILMSQVPPGFCRQQGFQNLFYYPETLRIKDAGERCWKPEYIIIGTGKWIDMIPVEIQEYCDAFMAPVFYMTWEEAEFSKISVNMMLAAQVDYSNRMADACTNLGIRWDKITEAIRNDKRIGKHSYLTPGRWQDSIHLLRDYVTLKEIEDAR